LCVGCITAVDAQSVFTQRIQQSNSGEGKVTVTQEKAIDDLVNGKTGMTVPTVPQKQTENNTTATNHQEKPERLTTTNKTETTIKTETTTVTPDTIDTQKKLMKGYKINGFRVQVFAGGNSRSDRLKAEKIGDEIKRVTCVSMGNPHAVLFVDNTEDLPLNEIGPLYENHRRFPNRINTEFVQVIDEEHVRMRVWERGSGETLACGTGCCATGVACVLNGKTGDRIIVDVLGGSLEIEWDKKSNNVWMTGPARTVFEGSVDTTALLKD